MTKDTLTDRQLTALAWVAGGATVEEVAAEMKIRRPGAAALIFQARQKLGARSSAHMVALAYQRGLLVIEAEDVTA